MDKDNLSNNSEVESKVNSEVESKVNSEVESKVNSEVESKVNSEVESEMEWSLFKILAKKILHLDPNTLIDYCDIEIDNKDLKIKHTYDIHPPNLEPRPKNLLSEWPPNDKMYFFHDYFNTQLSFVNLGDHIATFKPEHHSIVVMLSRIAILLNWCDQGCYYRSEEEEEFDKFNGVRLYLTELQTFFEKMSNQRCQKIPKSHLQSPMYNTTLKEIESFINDESGVIECGKRLQVQNDKKSTAD